MTTHEKTPKQRLHEILSAEYPLGEFAINALEVRLGDALVKGLRPESSFEHHPDKRKVDRVLVDWISGEIDDNSALTKLFPLAIHYSYGALGREQAKSLLRPEDLASYELATLIDRAWSSVLDQAPEPIADRHAGAFDDVGLERLTGIAPENFGKFLERRNRNQDPPSL